MTWPEIHRYALLNLADLDFLRALLDDTRDGSVVELGSYIGGSALVMAPTCREQGRRFITVDNFSMNKIGDGTPTRPILEENLREYGLDDWVEVVESDSAEAAKLFDDESVSLCFVDADHGYEAVQRDIEAWWPKIRPHGQLAGHDYLCDSVAQAVDEFFGVRDLYVRRGGLQGTCWSVRKP